MDAIQELGYWVFFVNVAYTIVFWTSAWTLMERRRGIYVGMRRSCWAKVGGLCLATVGLLTLSISFLPETWPIKIYTYVTPSFILMGTASLTATIRRERQLGVIAINAIRRELE